MRKIALILLMFAAAAKAEWRPLHPAGESQRPEFMMLDHSASGDLFEMILPGIEMTTAILDAKSWDRVEICGGGFDQEIGKPEVPQVTRLVVIPRTSGVRVDATILEEQLLSGIDLMPAQGIAPDEGPEAGRLRHFHPETYSENRFYPERPVGLGEPAIMRGLRVIPVQINPVRYDPVTRELRVATRMQIALTYEGQDQRNAPTRAPRRFSSSWAKLARSSIVNFDEVGELDETLTGSYLVICENDNALVNAINNQFVDWKRRKGHTVVLQTFTPGASNTTIKNMIQTAYNTWDPAPEFVLLVGDSDGDYALPGWEYYVGDHPYSQLDGSDLLADVSVGRMPAGTMAEAATLLNKVIWYEKQPYTLHDDWFHQGVLVASEGVSGISTIQTKRWIKTRMIQHGFTRIDTLWYNMGGSIATVVSNAINSGVSYFNYRGYLGMSGWQNYNTYALNNGFMLPLVTIPTCGTGGFSGESRAEAFAIAGTPTTGQGAVAAYGTATSGTNTRCNNVVDVGMYYGIFDEDINEAGNALNRGKLELFNAYIMINSGYVSNFSLWNNLAGDPGLELWTGPLAIIAAQIPDQLNFGDNQLDVTVTDTLNQPVEGALVCAYKANEMQIAELTQADGSAHLLLDPVTAGNVKVTITKENCKPILDSLNLVQQATQVGFYSSVVDDDLLGESRGDDDGLINPGETVEIPIMLKNFGSSTTVSDVRLVAATTDSLIRPGDMVESYGNIAPGATALSLDDIDFRVNLNASEGHLIHFDLTIISAQGSWTSDMELAVSAPILEAGGAAAVGGDGILSPGETAEMIITARNLGSDAATGVTAKLSSLNSWITLTDSLATYGTIAAGATVNNAADHFTLIASASAPAGWEAPLRMEYLTDNGFVQVDTFTVRLDGKNSSDPQGPDEYGYYCYDNTDLNYPLHPTYSWIEIDPRYGGSGTILPLNDYGEDQDMSLNIALPFTFQYYGMQTDTITVCSNGWISMVPNPAINLMRNWPIPSCMGPDGMVAPFWDDLVTLSNGHICSYADTANHQAIIEWSRLPNWGSTSTLETFEVILFDPAYYPTPTGDGEILFQYNHIVEVVGQYYDNQYSTVGIENPEQNDGIEIVYTAQYHDSAAAHLQDGRAYFFTTRFDYAVPDLQITLTPMGSPIVIPPGGGSFSYEMAVENMGTGAATGEIWSDILQPGGSIMGPVLGPVVISVNPGTVWQRTRTQNIPGSSPAGNYQFRGHVGIYPFAIWSESNFPFSKSGVDNAGRIQDWNNYGEPWEEASASAAVVPDEYSLKPAHPNPFNPATVLSFQLPVAGHVSLKIYDISGRQVAALVDGWREAGTHEAVFDGQGLSSGIYLYRLQANSYAATGKMVLVK